MRYYTVAVHVRQLKKALKLLNKGEPYRLVCPGNPDSKVSLTSTAYPFWTPLWKNSPCEICKDFVQSNPNDCPCHYFGQAEATKRTLLAIEIYESEVIL